MTVVTDTLQRVKLASRRLSQIDDTRRSKVLLAVADAIEARQDSLLRANARDLSRMDPASPLYDRLLLTLERLRGIAGDMRHVAALPSPLGRTLCDRTLDNGLRLRRLSVPFGVIGVIYEARPNVTYDVFALCMKSGNACVLKGGHDADESNRAAVALIHEVLAQQDFDPDVVALLPATHEATGEMLGAVGQIDVCIPRGGRRLIDFVRDTAKVPVIETGAGVVDTYLHADADPAMASRIVMNAKTRRVSVCNALDCLLVHTSLLDRLPAILAPLATRQVILYADEQAYRALDGRYQPADGSSTLLYPAGPDSWGTEYMDYKMAVRTVDDLDEALEHIARYGSGHSEAIVTASEAVARRFQAAVDAACVYWNAPTSFTDGAQFGLGAEIGISTQKLGPRGPMGLEEMTTYKWVIDGDGQIRS